MMEEHYVTQINTPLSNKPFYVKITDPTITIERIFSEAIVVLKDTGRPLESQQLDQLSQKHSIFNEGKIIGKKDKYQDIAHKTQTIDGKIVHVLELDLVASHSGGISILFFS